MHNGMRMCGNAGTKSISLGNYSIKGREMDKDGMNE